MTFNWCVVFCGEYIFCTNIINPHYVDNPRVIPGMAETIHIIAFSHLASDFFEMSDICIKTCSFTTNLSMLGEFHFLLRLMGVYDHRRIVNYGREWIKGWYSPVHVRPGISRLSHVIDIWWVIPSLWDNGAEEIKLLSSSDQMHVVQRPFMSTFCMALKRSSDFRIPCLYVYGRTCLQETLRWEDTLWSGDIYIPRMVSHLPCVEEPVVKWHLLCRDTKEYWGVPLGQVLLYRGVPLRQVLLYRGVLIRQVLL